MKKAIKFLSLLALTVTFCFGSVVFGQRATKPSPSLSGREGLKAKPDSAKRSLPKITSQADFDSIARIYNAKTPYALPHAMFIIDRKNKNKITSSIHSFTVFIRISPTRSIFRSSAAKIFSKMFTSTTSAV